MASFYAPDFLREFHIALVLGSLDAPAIWESGRWTDFVDILEPLASPARCPATATGAYAQPYGKKFKLMNFRSIDWHALPPSGGIFGNWNLLAPSDETCSREKRTPDVYASLSNRRAISMVDIRFNPVIALAIGADLPRASELLDVTVARLVAQTSAVLVARSRRTWGIPTDTGYNNGINETSWFISGIAGRIPDAEILSEQWDQIIIPL